MILTKKSPNHYLVTTGEDDVKSAIETTDGDRIIIFTQQGWSRLRKLTPEARALRELVHALEPHTHVEPRLVSALQEARVLVRRMEKE